jgi:ElaA protein
MAPSWKLLPFSQLSLLELYAILALRQEVFSVEQNCAYQDVDGVDPDAHHLMCWGEGNLLAYTRIIPAGRVYDQASIGRVVVRPSARGKGLAHELMRRSIAAVEELWGRQPIQIGAQQYLLNFYQQQGFEAFGEPYLEDGIPHVHMLRP